MQWEVAEGLCRAGWMTIHELPCSCDGGKAGMGRERDRLRLSHAAQILRNSNIEPRLPSRYRGVLVKIGR